MKIAVIGAGYWGKNHVRDLKKLGHNVVVCDLDQKNLDYCMEKFEADAVTKNLSDILKDKSIVAATVCVPNHLHFSTAKKLLSAGKHVLVEKPMCLKSSDCKKLAALAKKKKLVLNVGHLFRFNPSIIKLKELLDQKELGEIRLAKFSWTNLDPIYPDRDIISDLGVHAFDIFNFLFGKNPKLLSSTGEVFRKPKDVETALITARLGKTIALFDLSWVTPEKKRVVTIVGSKKMAVCDTMTQSIALTDVSSLQVQSIVSENVNPLLLELQHFVECIESKAKSRAPGKLGLEIVQFIEQAQKQLK